MEETKVYQRSDFEKALIEDTLNEVITILNEKGYNAKDQIVGYLISGDPGYISSHKSARKKIIRFERIKILEVLVDKFIK